MKQLLLFLILILGVHFLGNAQPSGQKKSTKCTIVYKKPNDTDPKTFLSKHPKRRGKKLRDGKKFRVRPGRYHVYLKYRIMKDDKHMDVMYFNLDANLLPGIHYELSYYSGSEKSKRRYYLMPTNRVVLQ